MNRNGGYMPDSSAYNDVNMGEADHLNHHHHHQSKDDSQFKRLDDINKSILKIPQLLITFFDELVKEKQTQNKVKQSKQIFDEVLKHFKQVEVDLINEISILSLASTGHQHEGSIYGAKKDYDLAKMRLHLTSVQLNSLKQKLAEPMVELVESEEEDEEEEEEEVDGDKSDKHAVANGNGAEEPKTINGTH